MIISLILSCYLIYLSFASLLMSLVVSVLFIFSLLGKTNSQLKPRSVFLGYSHLQRGYCCYSPDINHYFISTDVPFFEDFSFFSSATRPPVSDVLSILLVLPSPDFPSPPTDVVTRPLQVYTRHPRTPTLNHLLCHSHLLLQFCNHPMIYLLPFRKVPTLLLTHILCIIFSAYTVYLYPTLPLFPPYLLFSLSSGLETSNGLMAEEMDALYSNGPWELVALPPGKSPIGCRWVYTVKMGT